MSLFTPWPLFLPPPTIWAPLHAKFCLHFSSIAFSNDSGPPNPLPSVTGTFYHWLKKWPPTPPLSSLTPGGREVPSLMCHICCPPLLPAPFPPCQTLNYTLPTPFLLDQFVGPFSPTVLLHLCPLAFLCWYVSPPSPFSLCFHPHTSHT